MKLETCTGGLLTKEKILETVVYRMAGREADREVLEEMPHIQLLDLAAVYHCLVGLENGCILGLAVDRGTCRHYGIRDGELGAAARRNTEAGGFVIQKLSEVLGMPEPTEPMYILTNRERMYGASVMLYEGYFRTLAGQAGTDLYILPSSIHEVIAVPVKDTDPADLQDLVRAVNSTEGMMEPHEVLSDSVYRYSRNEGLTCAVPDTKRQAP